MYGFCLLLGLVSATLLGEKLCKKRGLDVEIFWRAVFYGVLFGLLGARLYHVINRIDYFIQRPLEIIEVWRGGLGIWGAVAGGLFGIYTSLKKINRPLVYVDVFAVMAPLAQAIGRWGNYFNKELFGYPTNLPWGIYIPQELRPSAFKYYDRFHPLFLYESILDFILFILLYRLYHRRKVFGGNLSSGSITMLYLAGYSLIRFPLEFLRPDPWNIVGFPVAGIVSVSVFTLSAILYLNRRKFYLHQRELS